MQMRNIINAIAEANGFDAWFSGSKAVDYNGEPMILYHGTDAPHFDEFDDSEIMWFAQYESTASTYKAKSGEGDERIIEVHLRVLNPFEVPHDIDMSQEIDLVEALEHINNRLERPLTNDDLALDEDFHGNGFEIINTEEFRDALIARGYDGICVLELDEPTWGVFDKTQVRIIG